MTLREDLPGPSEAAQIQEIVFQAFQIHPTLVSHKCLEKPARRARVICRMAMSGCHTSLEPTVNSNPPLKIVRNCPEANLMPLREAGKIRARSLSLR